MATPVEIEQWLQQGIAAAKTGQREQARFQLLDVVEQDQTNETAWYWLFQVYDRVDDQRICLENLILINPKNMWAKQELLRLMELSTGGQAARSAGQPGNIAFAGPTAQSNAKPKSKPGTQSKSKSKRKTSEKAAATPNTGRPVTLKLVTAFWVGISLMLFGSGIISTLEWMVNLGDPVAVSPFPLLNLTIGVIFVITGIIGITVAIALYFRSMAGFYGSLFLGMGLLLAGPLFSLISSPPNYISMTCTGGMSGMIILLTLAGLPGFKETAHGSTTG